MSKLSNTLLLLQILSTGRKYSVDELSKIVECSPRMVRIYKEELDKVGIFIDTIKGPYGGYVLNKVENIPSIYFNDQDINLLKKLEQKLQCEELNSLIEKMKLNMKKEVVLDVDQKEKFNRIHRAIKEHKKIQIQYDSKNKGISERIVEPHELSLYQDKLELIAFCTLKNDIRTFELDRILEIKIL